MKASKFTNRWKLGVWLRKTEESDEHLVAQEGAGVAKHRCIRRLQTEYVRKYSKEPVAAMMAVPWDVKNVSELPAIARKRGDGVVSPAEVMPSRQFPGLPGCPACQRRGE